MGRPLQAVGLLLMVFSVAGLLIIYGGGWPLVAWADPCVPDVGPSASASASPPPVTLVTMAQQNAPAINGTPVPAGEKKVNLQVFNATEDLTTPSPTPSATPAESPTPAPTATPVAAPCPVHRHRLFGEGPLEISGNGGIDLGRHSAATSTFNQTNDSANLSMQVHVARRTERTSISLDQSFGESSGTYNLSQLNLNYSTPLYLLGYGTVSAPADTQLSTGSFNRGFTIGVPHGRDEIDLIAARAQGINGESYGVLGLRHTAAYNKGLLFSQTLYVARGDQSRASNTTLDLSLGRYKAGQTLRGELAFSQSRGAPGIPDGTRIAYAVHGDFIGTHNSLSLGYFTFPEGYITLGQNYQSQNNFQLTERRDILRRGTFTFDYGDFLTSTSGVRNHTVHETANVSLPLSATIFSQTLVNFSQQATDSSRTAERDLGFSLSEQFFRWGFTQTVQTQRLTANDGSSTAQTQYVAGATRGIGRGFLNLQALRGYSYGDGTLAKQTDASFNYTQPVGRKAQISFGVNQSRFYSLSGFDESVTTTQSTTYGVTRRFSPVVGLRLTYQITRQQGVLGGTARALNVDIVGPLAFGGAARYGGRVNPNLPATVEGHVFLQNEASEYGLVGNRGIPNVLVSLDGGITQRTDASGSYEFRFVKPGSHTITISTGTLPVGIIPDTATQSFSIQGGQVYTLDFAAGLFAGVTGRVVELVNGVQQPVSGVQLTIDDKQRGYSGPDGVYQIGHLTPGPHVVSVVTDTLPSTVTVGGNGKQTVTVAQGNLSQVDWVLTGLGAISGSVLYAGDAGFGDIKGAANVYVVADPGQHAAITDEEGHFIIDNLPAGQYSLSLDEDSLPEGEAVTDKPDPVTVNGSDTVKGITFKLGTQAKQVILTFNGGANAGVIAAFHPDQVPPNSSAQLVVTTTAKKVKSVTATGDFGTYKLAFSAAQKAWIATIKIPSVTNGDYAYHVDVAGEPAGGADATVTVSNAIAPVVAHGVPAKPRPGEFVRVILKAPTIDEGDLVALEDGQQLKLPKPTRGVFAFRIKVAHALPVRGMIFTPRGERIPFVIQP